MGDPLEGTGLRVRILGRQQDDGCWKCEDCDVVLADHASLYAHREIVHPLAVEREHAEQNGSMDRGEGMP